MSTGQRIRVVGGVMLAALAALLLYLFVLMVVQHDTWSRRSQNNRYAFRAVPSMRGGLFDRTGEPLAWDEPSTELAVHYERFRRYHPVGAAVHAASLAAQLVGEKDRSYSYLDGPVGPLVALRDVLALPTRLLRPGALSNKAEADELATTVTTVLSACSGRSRARTYTAIREGFTRGGTLACGDVFEDVSRAELEVGFRAVLAELDRLEVEIQALGQVAAPPRRDFASLFAVLEWLRQKALGIGAGITAPETEDEKEQRLRAQTILHVFAQQVPFEIAASVRLGASRHPGLVVQPSVRRVTAVPPDSSLEAWLGRVVDLDRAYNDTTRSLLDAVAPKDPDEAWQATIVPEQFAAEGIDRAAFVKDAALTYRQAMLVRERRGTSGIEATLDRDLRGQLGMRFVERDKQRREQRMFGALRVESGADVRLTVDAALQRVVERRLQQQYDLMRAHHDTQVGQDAVAGAMVMIDARTGDVLAYAAMQNQRYRVDEKPQQTTPPTDPEEAKPEWAVRFGRAPGVAYDGNAALGSVVKPFVLIEHLRAEALGTPHMPTAAMEPCAGKMRFGDRRLGCLGHHGTADPVKAIADSCNTFFFQAAMGLEEEGLQRAYRRFGLLPDPGGPFAAAWMPDIPRLPSGRWNRPQMGTQMTLPLHGIGYEVFALPVDVARAYAALATGYLPTLGIVCGEARLVVPLDVDAELGVVHDGMRQCVKGGTAKEVTFPPGLDVYGKTGTAEVSSSRDNNAWFAGFLGHQGQDGVQIAFVAVLYRVRHGLHGGPIAGGLVADVLFDMQGDSRLAARYLVAQEGR